MPLAPPLNRYVRPEGRRPGDPIVEIRWSVVEKLGNPLVDYPTLKEFVHDRLHIPDKTPVRIRMYGRSSWSLLGGFYLPFARTVHVQPVTTLNATEEAKPNQALAHELKHLADAKNRPALTVAEMGFRWGFVKGSVVGAAYLGARYGVDIPTLATALVARRFHYGKLDPTEMRARKVEHNSRLVGELDGAIMFANSGEDYRTFDTIRNARAQRRATHPGLSGPAL